VLHERTFIKKQVTGARQKRYIVCVKNLFVLFGNKPVLFVKDRVMRQYFYRFYQRLVKRFILLIRQREYFGERNAVGYGDITLPGEDTILFDLIDRKYLGERYRLCHAMSGFVIASGFPVTKNHETCAWCHFVGLTSGIACTTWSSADRGAHRRSVVRRTW
jgi:hypothetical protein